jgi:soluble lytic murein transglycosylase-like protein
VRAAQAAISVAIGLLVSYSALAFANDTWCFKQASSRFGVPEEILRAISHVESGGNPSAKNTNKNGSTDIGHMQVNSYWLSTLAKYGITKTQLMDACTNTHVGAWILASNISRMGYRWEAIGAYNARNPIKAAIYTRKVAAALRSPTRKIGVQN